MRFPECLPSLIYLITDHLFILSLITYFITCLSFISRSLYVSGYSKFCFNFLLPLINSLDMCTYNLKIYCLFNVKGFPGGASGKEPTCQCRRHKRCRFLLLVGKIPWRRAYQPTPVFLPGESYGQRRLAGYSPQGLKESDMPEVT